MINENKRLLEVKPIISKLCEEAKQRLGYEQDPRIVFLINENNAKNPLGKTGYYIPEEQKIAIYVTNRHLKDIMRSLAHELVHHSQNCNGKFVGAGPSNEGYAQTNQHLREMEREAYEVGNMLFRDFEDNYKRSLNNE